MALDYELKFKQIEEEARHENAMRLLQSKRLDTHDESIGFVKTTLDIILARLNETTEIVNKLAVSQAKTEAGLQGLQATLQDLIQTIAREHSNGKASK